MSRTLNTNREYLSHSGLNDCRTVAEIQKKIVKKGKRNVAFRLFRAKNDKDVIAAWKQDLTRILDIFNVRSSGSVWIFADLFVHFQTELAINTNMMVADMHRNALAGQENPSCQHHSVGAVSDHRRDNTDYPPDTSQVSITSTMDRTV